MMIKAIGFKNYKIFKDSQNLELKPITVLIGKNNSGKSAVAKLPTLIEGSLESESSDAINLINDDVELGGELRDLIYGKANRPLEISIEYNYKEKNNKLNVTILITEEKLTQISRIDSWKLNQEIDLHYTGLRRIYDDEISSNKFSCSFLGFNLNGLLYEGKRDGSESPPLIKTNFRTDYIGPFRTMPKRDYRLSPQKFSKIGIEGENSYQLLIADALTTDKKLVSAVSAWSKVNFEGWEVRVNQDRAPIYQVELQKDGIRQNIKDTGTGIGQVLPIVIRAYQPSTEDTLIIIEEPESHLHPAAHGNLAELFVDSLIQGNKRYLIETHSQNFVLRLRRLIANKKLDVNDLIIYYIDFDEEKNESNLKEITVDEFGRVSMWPEGVFSETLDETIAIRTAQIENPKYGD